MEVCKASIADCPLFKDSISLAIIGAEYSQVSLPIACMNTSLQMNENLPVMLADGLLVPQSLQLLVKVPDNILIQKRVILSIPYQVVPSPTAHCAVHAAL